MYHGPKMCRTCLQMSRGDFKFVSLDSVDPLWESNSPNLKAQLMSLVPEMKIDDGIAFICTSCFIALRTAYEFKRMCQSTEKKFQSHNYKYRRPFGVGPGSPQFHVTLNENRVVPQIPPANINNNNIYHSQKLNYLQADTSIDITEHHLYDASRSVPRRAQYINNLSPKLSEIDTVLKPQNNNILKKPLNSQELKEKYNLGSQISILQTDKSKRNDFKSNNTEADLIKLACQEIPYLKEKNLGPDALNCHIHIQVLTHDYVRKNTVGKYNLDDIKEISHTYHFGKLEVPLTCQHCLKTFTKRFLYQMHQFQEHADKITETITKPKVEDDIKDELKQPLFATKADMFKKLISVKKEVAKFKFRKYIKCFICGKTCVSRFHLLQHCKLIHVPRITRKKKKSKTGATSKRSQYLRKLRTRTGHPFASTFRCSICDKGFAHQNELDVHMYVHTPVILSMDDPNVSKEEEAECQFTCYLCDKSFLKERCLKLHNIQMHLRNKPTTCKNCGRSFKSEFWYERHKCTIPIEESNPNDVPDDTNMFTCSFCDRKFSQLRFLKVHRQRTHKSFVCPEDADSSQPAVLDTKKEVDPMELYSNSDTSLCVDKGDQAGDGSNSKGSTDAKELVNSVMTGGKEEDSVDIKPILSEANTAKVEAKVVPDTLSPNDVTPELSVRRGRPSLVKDVKPLTDMPEPEIGPGPGRRGNRGLPKIQCDFCGELLEENRYDKHIAEHNKSRLQRRVSTTTTHIEEYDSDDLPLKCPICYKGFKRKYYYNVHINKHIEEGIDVPEEPASPTNDNPKTPTSSQPPVEHHTDSENEGDESTISESEAAQLEEDDIQGEEIILEDNTKLYVCCGKSFKLKAHFFRHYKIKHPNNINKKDPIKYLDPSDAADSPIPPDLSAQTDLELLEIKNASSLVKVEKEVQNLPELSIIKNVSEVKRNKGDLKKIETEPVAAIKTEPKVPNDLEIGLKEDMEGNKRKRKLKETEIVVNKKIKTESPEAVKLRNTVAAHLDDIEIVAVSPTPSLKYECTQCDKKFKQKSQFRDHQNVHTGEKPYKCEFCQPTHCFTQSSSLYFHIRKVHTAVMKNVSWAIQAKNGLCLVCLEVFEKHMAMYTHLRENYVENGFDCEMCSKTVTMTCHYKNHNIDPNDMDSFMLPQQNLEVLLTEDTASRPPSRISNVEDPDENINEADLIMSKARRCDPCGKMFKSIQYYNMHVKGIIHQQRVEAIAKGEPLPEEVPSMEQTNTDLETINTTTQSENIEMEEPVQNMDTNCKTTSKKSPRVGTFKCPSCDMLFITKTHLRKHRRTKHYSVHHMHAKKRKNTQNLNVDTQNMEGDYVTTTENIDDSQENVHEEISETDKDQSISVHTNNEEPNEEATESIVEDTADSVQTSDEIVPEKEVETPKPVSTEEMAMQIEESVAEFEAHGSNNNSEDKEMFVEQPDTKVNSDNELNEILQNNDQPICDLPLELIEPEVKLPIQESPVQESSVQEPEKSQPTPEAVEHTDDKPNVTVQIVLEQENLVPCETSTSTAVKENNEPQNMDIPMHLDNLLGLDKLSDPKKIIIKNKPTVNYEQIHNVPQRKNKPPLNYSPDMLALSNQNSLGLVQPMMTPPITQHLYSNQTPFLESKGSLHLSSPKYYRGEQFMPPPLHYPSIQERRLSHTYTDYPPHPANYFSQSHSTTIPNQQQSQNSSRYGPLFEQGFVIHEDEMMVKGLTSEEADSSPEQELLALLHNSNNSIYEIKKLDNSFDSEQEFIDLESMGPKILKQSLERLNKTEQTSTINADSSNPDSRDFLYGRSNDNVSLATTHVNNPNEAVDFQGGLPISHNVLNEMTHNFS